MGGGRWEGCFFFRFAPWGWEGLRDRDLFTLFLGPAPTALHVQPPYTITLSPTATATATTATATHAG